MRRTFVIGDIHGAYRALRQCLERAEFEYEEDELLIAHAIPYTYTDL